MNRDTSLSTIGSCSDCIPPAPDAANLLLQEMNENSIHAHRKTAYRTAASKSSSMPLAATSFLFSHRFVYDHPFLSPSDRRERRKEREECLPSLPIPPTSTIDISTVGTARTNSDAVSNVNNANKICYRRFLRHHAWDLIRNLLSTTTGVEKLREEKQVLHQAMWHRAPLDVVKAIVAHNPNCIDERDTSQRNALHVVALCWGEPEIVEYLLSVRQELANDVDHERRAPLHLLLVSFRDIEAKYIHNRKKSNYSAPPSSVIQQLVEVAPNALNEEDQYDMSPIEYAVCCNDLQYNTVQIMRNASEKEWRRKHAHVTGETTPTPSPSSTTDENYNLITSIPLASMRRSLARRQGICATPGAHSDNAYAYDVPTTISITSEP